MYTTWMGIDPGLKGGISVQYSNKKARAVPMPLDANGKFDALKISDIIDEYLAIDPNDLPWGYRPNLVYIEDVHAMPGQGVTSMFNFGFGVGMLHGIILSKGLQLYKVNPIRWKNKVLGNHSKDKSIAIAYCIKNFPEIDLIPKGKVYHDGMADALCISEYAKKFHEESTANKPPDGQVSKRASRSKRRS